MLKPRSLSHDPIDGFIKFDPDDSRPIYVGLHYDRDETTTALTWTIYRFTYTTTTSKNVTNIEKRTLAWNLRTVGW